ncbi:hypothetical protein AGOR_G00250210 [Albula goreensis]|uniref:RING-type domain-containing protein n=1 Tax=Albula goreensis TaxID=1534307 RepID=A0A8T3CGG5_9TELE|nr:hypothetical protein AGOR_G00250210 [Albula goreensis]
MKAGASSMWASCCGLLNEVMGTGGPVRGQQPFRFAPGAAYSNYPPTPSATPPPTPLPTPAPNASLVCRACGLAFSVFRRKYVCCDCKRSFCSLCSELQETLHRCSTCQLLRGTAFQRPQLMRLRVKDLRQYLQLRNIATDTCREKADLVDLVLCHRGAASVDPGNQPGNDDPDDDPDDDLDDDLDDDPDDSDDPDDPDDPDTGGLQPRPLCAPPSNDALSVSAPQGEPISRSDSSGTSSQENGESASLLNLESTDITPEQATPLAQRRARASLSDLANADDIESLSVRQLKEILARNFVNYSGCCEKWELVERVNRLYRETEENRRSLENVSNDLTAVVAYPSPICNGGIQDGLKSQLTNQDETLCRICMDAVIDCVLLECGHMVTCTRCGKRMNECPICRQYVVRAVHVFRS